MLIVLMVIVCVLIYILIVRNRIVRLKNAVARAWSDVNTYAIEKVKTFEELAQNIDRFLPHEKGLFESVTRLRGCLDRMDAGEVDTHVIQNLEVVAQKAMHGMSVSVEQYPELKSNSLVDRNMKEIARLNQNMSASLSIFNSNVESYNNYIQMFPNSFVNSMTIKAKPVTPYVEEKAVLGYTEYRPNI